MTEIKDKLEIWKVDGICSDILIDSYTSNVVYQDGLKIKLETESHYIEISCFQLLTFRLSDESLLSRYWEKLDEDSINGFVFYKMANSSYVDEISQLSYDFFADGGRDDLEHYCVFTQDQCCEILSKIEPVISILEKRE